MLCDLIDLFIYCSYDDDVWKLRVILKSFISKAIIFIASPDVRKLFSGVFLIPFITHYAAPVKDMHYFVLIGGVACSIHIQQGWPKF